MRPAISRVLCPSATSSISASFVDGGTDPEPGRGRLNGRVELCGRHGFPVDHAGHIVSLCDAAWPVRVVAADDDPAREHVAARSLARDDREVHVPLMELIGARRAHVDPRRLLETRHEPAPQYLVLLHHRDADLAARSLRHPAGRWTSPATSQKSIVVDARNLRTTFS